MRLRDLDESLTPVPIEETQAALQAVAESAVLPAQDQERSTACLLIVAEQGLVVACRTDGPSPSDPPSVSLQEVEWQVVGIGPPGLAGRVPGGLLGGAAASEHLLTIVAGDRLFEARVAGSDGPEAIATFAREARAAGASDFESD